MSDQNNMPVKKNFIVSLMAAGALLSVMVGGCSPKMEKKEKVPQQSVQKAVKAPERISLPGGAGVLLKDKQVVLIPHNTENRAAYEKRLNDINVYAKETGYTFVSIIDPENKIAYDAAMMTLYPKMYGKMYNMLDNPVSSWASMQIGGAEFVAKYTPADIIKAMREAKANYRTL